MPGVPFKTQQVMHFTDINCAERSQALISVVVYGPNPNQTKTMDGNPYAFDPVPPGSVGEAIVESVCKTQ